MTESVTISRDELIQQVKLSCQIPTIIEGILARKIIMTKASELDIKVESEELQKAADKLRLVNNLFRAEDTWSWLQKYHLSLDEFEEIAYTSVLSSKLAQHLFADKVESYFIEHQLNYAQVVLYEIVLDDEDLAMELFYALQEGEISFQEIARQYIEDIELSRAGGYRGKLNRAELKPEISAAVFVANPPEIIKPIVTAKGAHLIWVEELIHLQLDEVLREKIISDLFSEWLKQQTEQMEVKVDLTASEASANLNFVPH